MRKLTTQEFIDRARAIHGNRYGYSMVEYNDSKKKILIHCPDHGIFEQTPNTHLTGSKCPACSQILKSASLKLTTQEFIDSARAAHGCKYDYTFSVYQSAHEKVVIQCNEHGLFYQTPNSHLSGKGCPGCGQKSTSHSLRSTTQKFIEKARYVHGPDKYDYSQVRYITINKKVTIICKKHGEFKQTPHNHVSGQNCPSCSDKRHTTDMFIENAIDVHGHGVFDYSTVNYKQAHQKVIINCPEHGPFSQTPNSHLNGKGCPGCGNGGFDRTKRGYLYMLRSRCGRYVKIGITHDPDRRHAQLAKSTPFEFKRIELIEGPGSWVADMEKKLLSMSEPVVFQQSFDGYTEWRLWSEELRNTLTSF